MKRILFVDDEPRVLEGLERMLRPQRHRWEMAFAIGGEAALAMLEAQPFNVVVSDMRMPGIDGAKLLGIVRDRFPGMVRMVLSGYFEAQAAVRASPVAHQFLAKPCDAERLRGAVERACSLSAILRDEATRRAVTAIGEVPCLPRTYASLVEALEKPDISVKEVARVVEQDVGISAKVLQLVNSAFFGLAQAIETVHTAVGYLGLDIMKQLVVSVEIFRAFGSGTGIGELSLDDIQTHSRLTAGIAARLPVPKHLASTAPIAALLHDVGKLVLVTKLPQQFEATVRIALKEQLPLHVVEERRMGASHAEIGAYLLGLWCLPGHVVEAVTHHHHPGRAEEARPEFNATAAVHVADFLAHECRPCGAGSLAPPVLDVEYLEALGMAERLPTWRGMAELAAQSLGI